MKLAPEKGRKLDPMNEIRGERDPEIVNDMIIKLKTGTDYIGDLIEVSNMLRNNCDIDLDARDKYYGELATKSFKPMPRGSQDHLPIRTT